MILEILIATLVIMIACWILSILGFKKIPGKVHIHHAYFGIILLVLFFIFEKEHMLILGCSLIISDVFDHMFFINLREKIRI